MLQCSGWFLSVSFILTRIYACCVCQRLFTQTEQNVLRLDICMDDLTVRVQIVKSLKHLGIN